MKDNNQVDPLKRARGRRFLRFFAGGIILALLIGCVLPFVWRPRSVTVQEMQEVAQIIAILVGLIGLFVLLPAYLFPNAFARLFRREMIQRYLFGLACLATLIAGIYAVENWRGKRAWESCRKELEAKGAVLDWSAYIPPAIPDEQNIYKAPMMTEWFMRQPDRKVTTKIFFNRLPGLKDFVADKQAIALVQVIPPQQPLPEGQSDAVYDYIQSQFTTSPNESDTAIREKLKKLIEDRKSVVPATTAPRLEGAQNITLVSHDAVQLPPLRIVIRTEQSPSKKQLEEFLSPLSSAPLKVVSLTNAFRVLLKTEADDEVAAQDYLEWCNQFKSEFEAIRTALQRPCARLEGDYSHPFSQPIPNFVTVRMVAQTLAQKVQCHLLLNQPDEALRELTLLHDFRALLELEPTGQPMTLVTAMINVALVGLYETVVADGFRLGIWQETQITELIKQQSEIELTPPMIDAMKSHQGALTFMLLGSKDVSGSFFRATHGEKIGLFRRLKSPEWLMFDVAPSGWVHQNTVVVASLQQKFIEALSSSRELIDPSAWKETMNHMTEVLDNPSPYNLVARIAIPSLSKAMETTGMNQSKVHQGLIACGLERYRAAEGEYPETLQALTPRFLQKIPADIIGGQPMKYQRTDDGKFLLYSVGWDEKDDGGVTSENVNKPKDWVWGS